MAVTSVNGIDVFYEVHGDADAPWVLNIGGTGGDLRQTPARHLKDPDLICRAKAVLDRPQNAELVATLPFKIQHCVDHMLDHAGTGDLALFGDVTNEHDGGAAPFGEGCQFMG